MIAKSVTRSAKRVNLRAMEIRVLRVQTRHDERQLRAEALNFIAKAGCIIGLNGELLFGTSGAAQFFQLVGSD